MNVTVLCRDRALAPAESRLLERSSTRLGRFYRRIARVEWRIEPLRGLVHVRGRVHARSGQYHAEGCGRAVAIAVREALSRLLTQRRRRKAAHTRARRSRAIGVLTSE